MSEFHYAALGPTLRIVVLVFLILSALAALALVVVVGALPGRIAKERSHPQAQAVNVCGWVGLPTGILWAIAMVWAFWRHDVGQQAGGDQEGLRGLAAEVSRLERTLAAIEQDHKERRG